MRQTLKDKPGTQLGPAAHAKKTCIYIIEHLSPKVFAGIFFALLTKTGYLTHGPYVVHRGSLD